MSIPFFQEQYVIGSELLRHTVSVQTYSTISSWYFLLLTPYTPAVTGWAHCCMGSYRSTEVVPSTLSPLQIPDSRVPDSNSIGLSVMSLSLMHDITQLWGMCIIGKGPDPDSSRVSSTWIEILQPIDNPYVSSWSDLDIVVKCEAVGTWMLFTLLVIVKCVVTVYVSFANVVLTWWRCSCSENRCALLKCYRLAVAIRKAYQYNASQKFLPPSAPPFLFPFHYTFCLTFYPLFPFVGLYPLIQL